MPFPASSLARSGRFTDIRPIGRGACGQVYAARDNLGRMVAIKEALPSDEEFAWVRAKFQQEARIQAALHHPNIIAIYSLEEDQETHELYLICEYANGGSLADHLDAAGCVPEAQTIVIAHDVCAALEATWRQLIVHRDVKPSNILLIKNADGAIAGAKLGDFGVAQDQKQRRTTLMPGVGHPGTPLYMPPEQGNIATVLDVRADLYALGVTLWEMQTGRDYKLLPAPEARGDLQAQHPQLSPGMAAVIRRATQEDREQRYTTPQEMASELAAVRDGVWAPARATIALPRAAEPAAAQRAEADRAPRASRRAIALALLALLLVAPLAFWLGSAMTKSASETTSQRPQPILRTPREQVGKFSTDCLKRQADASQTEPLAVPQPIAGGAAVNSFETVKAAQQLARWDMGSQAEQVVFSPDGQILATVLSDGTVHLLSVKGGKPLRTLCIPAISDSGVARAIFTSDGQAFAAASADGTLQLWRTSDGALLRTLQVPAKGFQALNMAFAPDGQTLALSLAKGSTVMLVRVGDGQLLRTLEEKNGGAATLAFAPDGQSLAVGLADGSVQLWRVSDGQLLHSWQVQQGDPPELAFAPDGKSLAVGLAEGTTQLWSIDGTLLRVMEKQTKIPAPVRPAFAPDGQTLAAAQLDGTIQLWRVGDGALLRTLDGGPTKGRSSLAFTPDGRALAVSWEAGTVELWGVSPKT